MESIVDLRSDTVTKPTEAMRSAMRDAPVGDDVYREDPTVNCLQERAAEIFAREAALFFPSGSMANQAALKVWTRPGQEIICEERAHIFVAEMGMMAAFSGAMPRTIRAEDGLLSWTMIAAQIRPRSDNRAQTGLIELENTSNLAGGAVYPIEVSNEIVIRAHDIKLPVHLDGARIFNASVVLATPVAELTRHFDSVMFCLSKGLGAPVGSMLVGSRDFIEEARIIRKMMGGGMRQAGILAAAGSIALEEGPKRLHLDHENAAFLALGLAEISGIVIDAPKVITNIVCFDVSATGISAHEFCAKLAEESILAGALDGQVVRMVTHLDVDRAGCQRALRGVRKVAAMRHSKAAV
jgi:threonine aldolase